MTGKRLWVYRSDDEFVIDEILRKELEIEVVPRKRYHGTAPHWAPAPQSELYPVMMTSLRAPRSNVLVPHPVPQFLNAPMPNASVPHPALPNEDQ